MLFLSPAQAQIISTIAGHGVYGYSGDNGPALDATFSNVIGITADSAGNVYFCDRDAARVRKIDRNGIITTFAGGGTGLGDGGYATAASLQNPFGIACDKHNNIYVCDQGHHRLRKITSGGRISTVAGNGSFGWTGDGGSATNAEVGNPCGVAVDINDNIYIGSGGGIIRKVSGTGTITTVAGNDTSGYNFDNIPATNAWLSTGAYITVDQNENLLIADTYNNRIRKVDHSSGIITTIAGNGHDGSIGDSAMATAAKIHWPLAPCLDRNGDLYFINNNKIRVVQKNTGIINTYSGSVYGYNGDTVSIDTALYYTPQSMYIHPSGDYYIGDYINYRIRKIFINEKPYFVEGHRQSIALCENQGPYSLIVQNVATDPDTLQNISWKVAIPPRHGRVTGSSSAVSDGHLLIRSGMNYVVDSGYFGLDSFAISVDDEWATDTTYITANITRVYSGTSITGPSEICSLTTATFRPNYPGGRWYCTGGGSMSDSTLVGAPSGTSRVYYVISTACAADTATASIFVTALPRASVSISGIHEICAGTSVTFSATTVNPGSAPHFQWYKNGTPIGADNFEFSSSTLSDRDNIYCRLTSDAHCILFPTVSSNTISMTVHPIVAPSVSINGYNGAIICNGDSISLTTDITNGGRTPGLFWYKNGILVDSGRSYQLVPDFDEHVKCRLVSSEYCPSPTYADDSIRFNVYPRVTPNIDIVASGGPTVAPGTIVTLTAEPSYEGTMPVYQWFKNGRAVSGANSNMYSVTVYETDSVYCTLLSNLVCITKSTDTSNGIKVMVQPLSTPTIGHSKGNTYVYPNPNTGKFTISFDGNFESGAKAVIIEDVSGKTIFEDSYEVPTNGKIEIDLQSRLVPGSYLLTVLNDGVAQKFKVIVQ